MEALSSQQTNELDALFKDSLQKLKAGDNDEAVRLARYAWAKLPEHKFDHDHRVIYTDVMIDIYRGAQRYVEGIELAHQYMEADGIKADDHHPAYWFGTLYFEQGDLEQARRWLAEANKRSGGRCFRPPEARKYRDFLRGAS